MGFLNLCFFYRFKLYRGIFFFGLGNIQFFIKNFGKRFWDYIVYMSNNIFNYNYNIWKNLF